jgi:hypothetical protein
MTEVPELALDRLAAVLDTTIANHLATMFAGGEPW